MTLLARLALQKYRTHPADLSDGIQRGAVNAVVASVIEIKDVSR